MAYAGTSTTLFGRDAELDQLDRDVAAAAAGAQRAVVVLGEAGIGKSALLAALRERAAGADMQVLHGVGAEHERDVPFAAVVDALDDHVATLHARRIEALGADREADLAQVLPSVAREARAGAVAAGAAERFRYHRALRALLDLLARERPVALVLDDLHWADDATVELVLHLLRRPLDAPLLLAVGLRPAAVAGRVVDALRHAGAEPLELGPLGRDDAERLLGAAGGGRARGRVLEEAGGNPLFLRELAKVGGERLPPTLVAAVRLELDGLDAPARALIEGAAVAGDPFDLGLAAVAAGVGEADAGAALEPLIAADLVRSEGALLRFRHPVIRRAVHEAAPAGRRLLGHRNVSDELRRRGAGPAARAYHVAAFARPGDDDAVALLSDAAVAVRARAPAAAARWYEAALHLLDADAPRNLALRAELAGALADAGQVERAHSVLVDLLDAWPAGATFERTRVVAACAGLEQVLGRHDRARGRLERALADLPEDAPPGIRAALTFELGAAAAHRDDAAALTATAGRASALIGEDEPGLWVADQGLVATAAIYAGDTQASADVCRRATERFAALDDAALARRPDAAYYLGWAQIHLMWLDDAVATATRGLEIARRGQLGSWVPLLAALSAVARYNRGEPDAALAVLELAEDSSRLQGLSNPLSWTLWMQALCHDLRGDGAEARRRADECLRVASQLEDGALERSARCAVALVRVWDEPERSVREIQAAAGRDVELMEPQRSTTLLGAIVAAAVAAGDLDEARRTSALLDERARELGMDVASGRARAARAVLLLAEGEPGRAAAAARAAIEIAGRTRVVVDELPARLTLGRALAASGDRDAAVEALRATAERAEGLGALRYADAAARELRRLGVRQAASTRRPAEGRDGLSPRELEVAELAAAGRSNKEIAAALFLSVKTVENHLSRVFAQVGVRSRVELARTWDDGG
jgi:ATP/maltotriose-dependent transcriptional regulator MalT